MIRTWKRRLTTALARHVVNPVMRRAIERGIAPPGYALVETIGRSSGLPRRTPVGDGLDGDTFWIVAEHGRSAAYIRNIAVDPHVRIKVGRRWRSGTAVLLPDDDPRERQRLIGRPFNAALVRFMGTDLLTVRVDLEPLPPAKRWMTLAAMPPSSEALADTEGLPDPARGARRPE